MELPCTLLSMGEGEEVGASPPVMKEKISVKGVASSLLFNTVFFIVNPLTPMSDQDRISPYNINTESSRQVRRIKKEDSIRGLQVDPMPNSPN